MKLKYIVPLVLFLALVIFFVVGLGKGFREVPSPLIDKPAPEFALPRLDDPSKVVSKEGYAWSGLVDERLVFLVRFL